MFIDLGNEVVVVGGGLVGCLLAVYLRKHNFSGFLLFFFFFFASLKFPFASAVTIFESRSDPRLNVDQGRSINLVITSRGIAALTGVSEALANRVMSITVPVFGRTLHSQDEDQVQKKKMCCGLSSLFFFFSSRLSNLTDQMIRIAIFPSHDGSSTRCLCLLQKKRAVKFFSTIRCNT
jgi:hypothetical protein